MALDTNLRIYQSNSLNINANAFNVQSNGLAINRTGLPAEAEFVTTLETPNADRTVTIDLLLSVDGNITNGTIIARTVYPIGFAGVKVAKVSRDFNPQEYANANIVVGTNLTATNHANANVVGRVEAYLAKGEKQVFGRKATAETLATPIV